MDTPAPPRFEQVGSSPLYETRVAGSIGWAGYLLPGTTGLPPSIAADATLTGYSGHYLFCVRRPAGLDQDPDGFARDAIAYISAATNNRAVAWLASGDPVGFGPFSQYAFPFLFVASVYQATGDLNLPFGSNANFYILAQTRLAIVEGALQLSASAISPPPFIGFRDKNGLSLGVGLTPVGNRIYARVPFSGPSTGCTTFDGAIDTQQAFKVSKLGQGFRYGLNAATGNGAQMIRYGALAVDALPGSLPAAGAFDLSDPANRVIAGDLVEQGYLRSGLALKGAPALASGYRTAGGQTILLSPVGASAADTAPAPAAGGFAWASEALIGVSPATAPAYLAPAGTFGMSVATVAPGTRQTLLAGLFGSETLSFATYDGGAVSGNDLLVFVPSRPGFAPVFPFDEVNLDQPESGAMAPRLSADCLTSWSTISAGDASVGYSAQPEGSPLYAAAPLDHAPEDETVAVLDSAPPSLPLPQGTARAFPMAPYAALEQPGADGETLVRFESQILSATRKSLISAHAEETWAARARCTAAAALSGSAVDGVTDAATPQGFLVQRDGDTGAYLAVTLAQSVDAPGKTLPFALGHPTRAMQDALQTNQLCLVAVNPEPFVDPQVGATFQNAVDIAGWSMAANVGAGASATAYKNVLIMKFCQGALADLVANPNKWTAAESFSLLPGTPPETRALAYTGLSQWLQDYIAAAIDRAHGPAAAFYRNFAQIVADESWTGVIVLAADLSAQDLPAEIAGLAAGIDFTRFAAHHFGFTVSRLSVDKGSGAISLSPGPSSLFGLIDYEDPRYASALANGSDPDTPVPVPMTGPFEFTVLQLQSLFANAALVDFQSHVQLSAQALFGAPVSRVYRSGQPQPFTGIVLNGSYVEQDGRSAYVFEQNDRNVLASPSNVLPAVAFSRVQFNTLGPRDNGATMAANFLVWGAFDFTALTGTDGGVLDLLSFGSPAGTPAPQLGTGLAFAGLSILMTYPSATPSAKQFALDTNNLAYDLNASVDRADSLFRGFALQLKSFVNAAGSQKPADLGFLPVTSQLNLTQLAGPWYGIVYDITLGGPGALASGMGFQSQLLTAWAPVTTGSDAQQAVFVGMSLPGAAPGASLFSLQGILKVAVGSISILRQPVAKSQGTARETAEDEFFYCLRIDDIAIKIFGIVKLPPSANIQFFLFGDPDTTGSLGWYAAYVADDNPGCEQSLAYAPIAAPPPEARP